MIFADSEIDVWGVLGGIDPFDEECVNPASIDLRWSGSYKIANKPRLIDILVRKLSNNKPTSRTFWSKETHCEWLTMEPGRFYLMDTLECVHMPEDCVGKLFLKSSAGRMGIEHLHAGYIDPDFLGTITMELEIRTPWPVTIYRGQKIMQMTIETMTHKPNLSYSIVGRYQNQTGPTESKGLM